MIKITAPDDLKKVEHTDAYPYIRDLLEYLLKQQNEDCPDLSTPNEIGAFFLLEQESDWESYRDMGFLSPITESRFEWIEEIGFGYTSGIIVINNDLAITIIGKSEYFKEILT